MKKKQTSQEMFRLAEIISEEIVDGRKMLGVAAIGDQNDWKAVLDHSHFWQLKHEQGGLYSVKNMTSEELKQSLIEDLLSVHVENSRGAMASYPLEQMFRHLENLSDDKRIKKSLKQSVIELIESGMIVEHNNLLSIPMIALERAQDYSGYYILSAQEYEGSSDMVDNMISTGGKALLSDAFKDIIRDVDEIDSGFKP